MGDQAGRHGTVYAASNALINPSAGERATAKAVLLGRVRRPIRGGLEIAVVSIKGGVGKTTVVAGLGLVLAEHRADRVVVVDANPDAGTLADRLTGEASVTLRQMLDNIDSIESLTDVSRYTSEAGRLHVIASEQDPAKSEAFNRAEYERICAVLARYYNILITDSGTGMTHSAMEGTLARAGALIVVGSPTVDGASRASKTLDWLHAHGYAQLAADSVVVLCCDRTSEYVDADRVRAHFASRCRGVVEIPYDPHLAIGGRIDWSMLREPVQNAYLTLASLLIDPVALPSPDSMWNRPASLTGPEVPQVPPFGWSGSLPVEPELLGPPATTRQAPAAPRASSGVSNGRRLLTTVFLLAILLGGIGGIALLAQPWQNSRLETTAATPPEPAPLPPPAEPAKPMIAPSVPVPAAGEPIPVGETPGHVAVAPNGRLAYVANREARVITVVDTATNQVTATIPVASGPPQFITFAPDGRRAYLSIFDQGRTILSIGVLDTTTNEIVATVPVPTRPYVSALTPDGRRLYVPNHDSGTVTVVDTTSNTVVKEIPVPPNPHCIELSRDGTRAYMANHESNVVSVLDTTTDTVIAQIPVGTSPHSVAVHPQLPLVANVNYDSHSVSMIDTNTNQVIATVPVGRNPQDITWAPDGRFAYVANVGEGTISVIATESKQVTATIPTGESPTSIAVLPDGRAGYVTNLDSGTLSPLRLSG